MTKFYEIRWELWSHSISMTPSFYQACIETGMSQTEGNWPDLRLPSGDSCTAPAHTAPHWYLSEGCRDTSGGSVPAHKQHNAGCLLEADMGTKPNTRTCPNASTFSVGMNMPGYTFCKYHLNGLHFSRFLRFTRSVRSPMSRPWRKNQVCLFLDIKKLTARICQKCSL